MTKNDYLSSKYGCIRYLAHPWARAVCKRAMAGIQISGTPTQEFISYMLNNLRPSLNELYQHDHSAEDMPLRQALLTKQMLSVRTYAAYVRFGRQIFEFSSHLSEAFRLTDVNEATLENLKLPYKTFFLHFGKQQHLLLSDSWRKAPEYVDGAYVVQDEHENLLIEFSMSHDDGACSNLPGPHVLLFKSYFSLGATEAISRSLDDQLLMFEKQRALVGTKSERTVLDDLLANIREQYSTIVESASLIANTLFFLSEPIEDVVLRVEERTPQAQAQIFLHGKIGQRLIAKQRLHEAGYAVVRYIGAKFSTVLSEKSKIHGVAVAHWRRGHWRNQRSGADLNISRRIWIMPVVVNQREGTPDRGRVYTVGKREEG